MGFCKRGLRARERPTSGTKKKDAICASFLLKINCNISACFLKNKFYDIIYVEQVEGYRVNKRKKINLIMLASLLLVVLVATYFYVPKFFADEVYPLKYDDFIRKYSVKYNVDPTLVAAVILQESRFNPSSVSGAGAQGLMQFMPGTAATMAKETGRWPNYNIFDAETSVEFGAAHLRDLLQKYNGNVDLALYAYNTGTGNADRFIGSPSAISNYSYVARIKNYQTVYKTMYATQLGVEPVKLQTVDPNANKNQVRGFVWSQIFVNFSSYFDKSQDK